MYQKHLLLPQHKIVIKVAVEVQGKIGSKPDESEGSSDTGRCGAKQPLYPPKENFISSLGVSLALASLVSYVAVWNVPLPCLKKKIQSP